MSRRVYLGRLPPNAQKADVEDHFKGYGSIVDIRLLSNFGFVEFESSRDAEDVVKDFNGRSFMGENIIVEPSKETRRRDTYESRPPRGPIAPKTGVRINVIGIPSATSWQDLKDFGRLGGNNIIYADVNKNNSNNGIIEYPTLDEAEEAIKRLEGVDINGTAVTLEIVAGSGGEGDNFRREYDRRSERRDFDDRRGPRGYDDRRDDRRAPPPRDYGRRDYGSDRRDDTYRRDDSYRRDDRRDDRYPPRDRSPRRDYDAPRDRSPRRDFDAPKRDYEDRPREDRAARSDDRDSR